GLWNLYQLANALYPLVEDAEPFQTILDDYKTGFETKSLNMMRSKLGLEIEDAFDASLIQELEDNLLLAETDMTIFFRNLSGFSVEKASTGLAIIKDAFYNLDELSEDIEEKWQKWFKRYADRLSLEQLSDAERKAKMNVVNPKYV